MIRPLDEQEHRALESLAAALSQPGHKVTARPEFGDALRRANALIEQYERIEPQEGRRVWAAAFTDALRDRKLSLADSRELADAKEQADIALAVFLERFGGPR